MNTKHYLVISGIVGGVIGSMLTSLLVPPVTAQRDKYGEIECRKLTVVDEDGKTMAIIGTGDHGGGRINLLDNVGLSTVELNASQVFMGSVRHEGSIRVYGEGEGDSRAYTSIEGHWVWIYGEGEWNMRDSAVVTAGYVCIKSSIKTGSNSVNMQVTEDGGSVDVRAKDNGSVVMHANATNKAGLSTFD